MNKKFIVLIGVSIFAIFSCKNNPTTVGGGGNAPAAVPTSVEKIEGEIYGNSFIVQNTSAYENLLSACSRCGLRRIIHNPLGGTSYQRFSTLKGDPKRCESWNSEGYIQIIFAEQKLPTKATVSFYPKFIGRTGLGALDWNPSMIFELANVARPINKNKGFQILLNPPDGLKRGSIDIWSKSSNHVDSDRLNITVTYGGSKASIIISEQLIRQKGRAVKKATFDCQTYPN